MKIKSLASSLIIVFIFHTSPAQTQSCDPAEHDKLAGAQNRTPTDCEVQFDMKIRKALSAAFDSVKTMKGWIVQSDIPVKEITGIGRGTEKYFYCFACTDEGSNELDLQLDPASAAYAEWAKEYNDLFSNPDNLKPENFNHLQDFTYKMYGAIQVQISVSINESNQFVSFKGGHETMQVKDAAYAIRAPLVQARTGGDIGDAHATTFVYFGKWKTPAIQKNEDGSESIEIQNNPDKSDPKLSIQNICIRIEADSSLADEVIRKINFEPLQNLVSK